jgi:hypothetical protein
MLKQGNRYALEREKALAHGLREVAAELRMIDVGDLIAFVRTGQFGNIATLVSSSAELYFKPQTLAFGRSGEVRADWSAAPAVSLDMEFRYRQVCVHFRLLLEAMQAGVEIDYINFEDAAGDPNANTARLVEALAAARLAPAARAVAGSVGA